MLMKKKRKKKLEKEKRILNKKLIGEVTGGIIIFTLIVLLVYTFLFSPQPKFQFKAAIIDQLSINPAFFNKYFNNTVTSILRKRGFTIDYYPGEKVKINFYRNLATQGYGLIIFRVHSTVRRNTELVDFFTSEEYVSGKYVEEQLDGRISKAGFINETEEYFAIGPDFVKRSMNGRFGNTIVIAMGCSSLEYLTMAKEFIDKGAKVYIGWDGPVFLNHTDEETIKLIQQLLEKNKTIAEAIAKSNPDLSGSKMCFYPDTEEVGEYTFTDITDTSTLHLSQEKWFLQLKNTLIATADLKSKVLSAREQFSPQILVAPRNNKFKLFP